jgi:cupin fold WbuC family metalloprotein
MGSTFSSAGPNAIDQLRAESAEVYYSNASVVTASTADVVNLKRLAAANPRLRSRLCTHPAPSANLHEMLIVHHRDVYVRPHLHTGKSESFHVVEGSADVVIFREDGRIQDVMHMGAYGSGHRFYYRMPESIYHSLLITSEWLVFHETTSGPFDRQQTRFPEWAPDEADAEAVRSFRARIAQEAAAFIDQRQGDLLHHST